MKVLVIPDVHLKPWMFDAAAKVLRAGAAGQAVCRNLLHCWIH